VGVWNLDAVLTSDVAVLYLLPMRGFVFLLAGLLVTALIGGAQNPNCVAVDENGDEVTLRANSWDPVAAIGRTLANRYGINVSVEAPKWAFPGDTEDVAVADLVFSEQHGNIHYDIMKRHGIQIRFSTSDSGHPNDVPRLLREVADAANREMPYGYRLDVSGDDYALVPTRTRNSTGDLEDVVPLLDRKVTIPLGTRSIAEHARLMAEDLSRQTGLHVGCCQALVAGVPWGMAEVTFEADNKPAREVLKSLLHIEEQANSQASNRHPIYDHWVVGCDGTGAPWCFVEVEGKFSSRCP
jgi:hypothetical protein